MANTHYNGENLPFPVDLGAVIRWLEKMASHGETLEATATELIDEIYDIGSMADDELLDLCRHLKSDGHYAEKFGLVLVLDGRAAGWLPNSADSCRLSN